MPRGGYRDGAGRKGGWKNSETQVIRVPKNLAVQILDIARNLDAGFQVVFISPEEVYVSQPIAQIQIEDPHSNQMGLFVLTDLINDSVTQSENLNLDSVTESNTPSSKPDGKRWLSSKDAWSLAQKRGCDRNLEGFRRWAERNSNKCLELFFLRKLPSIRGRNNAPAFEDLRYSDDPDCQDF
jgi:hypothetical protein